MTKELQYKVFRNKLLFIGDQSKQYLNRDHDMFTCKGR